MLKSKTVFIIGAVTGADYNLPIGNQLAKTISQKLQIEYDWDKIIRGDKNIASQLKHHFPNDFNLYLEAAYNIHTGVHLVNSIDDFLDLNQEDERINTCGKVAIVRSILESERHSRLYINSDNRNDTLDMDSLSGTWLTRFFKLLIRSSKPETAFDNVAFVNFNYDRCLEFFFNKSLKALYRLSQEDADRLISNIKIYHPYGIVGQLQSTSFPTGIPFGSERVNLVELAKGIKTYTEKIEERETETIRDLIRNAETLVFLGFAFHEQNMRLITPQQGCEAKRVLATAYGISNDDTIIVRKLISQLFHDGRARLLSDKAGVLKIRNDLDCSNFLDQYSLTLAN